MFVKKRGYTKRHQKAGFQRYLDDAMGKCNETIVGLEQIKDIYNIELKLCCLSKEMRG